MVWPSANVYLPHKRPSLSWIAIKAIMDAPGPCPSQNEHVPFQADLFLDSLRGSSVLCGTRQRRLAWPLRKDDTHKSKSVSTFLILLPKFLMISLGEHDMSSLKQLPHPLHKASQTKQDSACRSNTFCGGGPLQCCKTALADQTPFGAEASLQCWGSRA